MSRAGRILARLGMLAVYGIIVALMRRRNHAPAPVPVTGATSRSPRARPRGDRPMSAPADEKTGHGQDRAPGDERLGGDEIASGVHGYLIGLGLALVLTGLSFYVASGRSFVWSQGIPVMLVALAIAQIGVHLVFFLHITTGSDNTNNVLALAFGTLIVFLVLAGSLWIMANLNHNMMPMEEIMKRQR